MLIVDMQIYIDFYIGKRGVIEGFEVLLVTLAGFEVLLVILTGLDLDICFKEGF